MNPRVTPAPMPSTPAAGRATTGPSTTKPMSIASAPSPARASAPSGDELAVTTTYAPAPAISRPRTARSLEAPERSTATSRSAASGATREARIAGVTLATSVVSTPTRRGGDDRARRDDEPGGRQREAGAAHQGLQAGGEAEADAEPDGRGDDADDERLEGDRHDDLAPGGADRPQQRGLTGPLGHEDREGVVDAERGDDEGDPGEGQQDRLEHVEEVGADVVLLLGGQLCLRQGLDAGRDLLDDLVAQGLPAHAGIGGHEDGRDGVRALGEQLARLRQRERRVGRRAEAVELAERGDADDRDLPPACGVRTVVVSPMWRSPSSAAPRSMTTSPGAWGRGPRRGGTG